MAIFSLRRVSRALILCGVVLYAGSQCWLAIRDDRQQLGPLDNDLPIISAILVGIGGALLWLSSRPKRPVSNRQTSGYSPVRVGDNKAQAIFEGHRGAH